MAQTFNQLIRIHKNIAVQYEVRVMPAEFHSKQLETPRWFKHEHWQETLQLLQPVVQAHVIKGSTSPGSGKKSLTNGAPPILKGHNIFISYSFEPSFYHSTFSTNVKGPHHLDDGKQMNVRGDIGGKHTRYDIYKEKLTAVVCNNLQALKNMISSPIFAKMSDDGNVREQNKSHCMDKASDSPSVSKTKAQSILFTKTESIKCHQDISNRINSLGNVPENKIKALSSCQLGSKHKCRSSAVKLSPSSAMAQENIAVKPPSILRKKRPSNLSHCDWKRAKYLDGSPQPKGPLHKNFPARNGESERCSSSSLITSTESITCTVIGHDGRKSVTSPQSIRLVDKHLPASPNERADFKGLPNVTASSSGGKEISAEDHQKEVTKMFDQLFAYSAANSSPDRNLDRKDSLQSKVIVKPERRQLNILKLFRQHGLQPPFKKFSSPDITVDGKVDDTNVSIDTDDLGSNDRCDFSESYDKMRKSFKSVRNIKEIDEDTLNCWFDFNEYYLRGIFERKIYCKRHEDYKRGGKSRLQLNYKVHHLLFGESQLDFIMHRLMKIFSPLSHRNMDYLLKVLLPEVLIKIFMDVHDIGHDESENKMEAMMLDESYSHSFH